MSALREQPRDEALEIFRENPHGPNWAERLADALRREYGVRSENRPALSIVHGVVELPPLCACGCGERVHIRLHDGKPNRFRRGHNLHRPAARERAQRQRTTPKQAVQPKPRVRRVVAVRAVPAVPRSHECAVCAKPFGPDRPRHWFRDTVCHECES